MKKIITLFICFIFVFSLVSCGKNRGEKLDEDKFNYETLPQTDAVVSHGEWNGFSYTVGSEGYASIAAYTGSDTNLVIPEEIDGKPITNISKGAFHENKAITSVSIPDSVTAIGDEAFYLCESLETVTIGEKVAFIGGRAFTGTPFLEATTDEFFTVGDGVLLQYNGTSETVTIPNNIKCIAGAFEDNAMVATVIFHETLTHISSFSFASCISLTEAKLPEGLLFIGDRAFAKCVMLKEINIPDSVMEIGRMSYLYCTSATTLKLSERLSVIPVSAFQSCSAIEEVTIPSSVTTIDAQAFLRCKELRLITIPDSVTQINDLAFSNCSSELTVVCEKDSPAIEFCNLYSINYKTK